MKEKEAIRLGGQLFAFAASIGYAQEVGSDDWHVLIPIEGEVVSCSHVEHCEELLKSLKRAFPWVNPEKEAEDLESVKMPGVLTPIRTGD